MRLIVNCTVWCHQAQAAHQQNHPNQRPTRASLIERIFRDDLARYGIQNVHRPAEFVPPRSLMSPQFRHTFEQRRTATAKAAKRKYNDLLSEALDSFVDKARRLAPLIDLHGIVTDIEATATIALEDALSAEQEYHHLDGEAHPFPDGTEDDTS